MRARGNKGRGKYFICNFKYILKSMYNIKKGYKFR